MTGASSQPLSFSRGHANGPITATAAASAQAMRVAWVSAERRRPERSTGSGGHVRAR